MRTHHCEKMPIAIEGLTEVLMPTDRKHEYWRMIGVLKFSKPAFGQMYHCKQQAYSVGRPDRGFKTKDLLQR